LGRDVTDEKALREYVTFDVLLNHACAVHKLHKDRVKTDNTFGKWLNENVLISEAPA